jgi:hypothetical protein
LDEIHNSGKPLDEPLAHIHDYIGTSKFRISPTAFFQVCPVCCCRQGTLFIVDKNPFS